MLYLLQVVNPEDCKANVETTLLGLFSSMTHISVVYMNQIRLCVPLVQVHNAPVSLCFIRPAAALADSHVDKQNKGDHDVARSLVHKETPHTFVSSSVIFI